MDPKFQSSFIPKGSSSYADPGLASSRPIKDRNLFTFIASMIFSLSVIAALGSFGYKFYTNYRIEAMKVELATAKDNLQPEVIEELVRLDAKLNSAKGLITNHTVITPIFEFLESSTPVTVRFEGFDLTSGDKGITLRLVGQARGYGALALQADIFNKNAYFQNSIFSDFALNQKGDVIFTFETTIDPTMLSYERKISANQELLESLLPISATSTATTTPQ